MLTNLINKYFGEFFAILGRNVKNDLRLIEADYYKVRRIIKSCQCKEHLDVANKVITLFYMKYDDNRLLERLEKKYKLLNQNF